MTSSIKTDLVGLVLAGGLSSRFGSDKALHVIDSLTLVQHAFELLSSRFTHVYVSCRKDQNIHALNLPCLFDSVSSKGPISGIISASETIAKGMFVLAVDYIDLDLEVIDALLATRALERQATAFAHEDGVLEPLCTIYEKSAIQEMQTYFTAGHCSLSRLLGMMDVEQIPMTPHGTWTNLNSPKTSKGNARPNTSDLA